MDISRYIGLFLLKNKYCCLQGLGNLEIKKTPSKHNGAELTGSAYYATLNPVGSIDDAFPHFVATNEQVSIAKASNEISTFISEAKARLAEGGTVSIPSVGEYVQRNNQIQFVLDPAFSLPQPNIIFPVAAPPKKEVAPAGPVSSSTEEKPYESFATYNNYNQQRTVNWNIVAFWSVIVIIGGSILGWSINYFMKQQSASSQPAVAVQQEPVMEVTTPTVVDTNKNASAAVAANDTPEYKFIIKEYKTEAQARKKEKQLISYGYAVQVVARDSNLFYVVQSMKIPAADTLKIKDSLTKLLNPAGVQIMQ